MKSLVSISICILLTGCLVGPNYCPPQPNIPDAWTSDTPDIVPCVAPPIAWWEIFNDPLLNKYIDMAARCNNDVLNAEANICQARAMRQVAVSELFPHISADLNATRTYFSKNGPVFAFTPGGQNTGSMTTGLPFQIQIPQTQNLYNALIDASWEIDIFGKRRRNIEVAEANIGSAIEQRNNTLITILAEVALNYIQLRSNQSMGVLIEENIALYEQSAAIAAHRFRVGYASRLDLERIEAEMSTVAATLPDIYAQIYQNIYVLSILTGNLPETLLCELLPIQPLPCPPPQIAVGIRSDLLRRRPDVRGAERQLAAATANIGVAVASFFPTFTLFGDIGFQSLHLSNLFSAKSITWALEGDMMMPLFQGGRLVGNLRVSEAQAAAAAFTYQQTVLTALKEAESGLIAYTEELQTSEQLMQAVRQYESLVSLSQERYASGLVSITDLLTVEEQWNVAAQSSLTSKTAALIDIIMLYKALGGGWQPENCL